MRRANTTMMHSATGNAVSVMLCTGSGGISNSLVIIVNNSYASLFRYVSAKARHRDNTTKTAKTAHHSVDDPPAVVSVAVGSIDVSVSVCVATVSITSSTVSVALETESSMTLTGSSMIGRGGLT